MTITCIPIQIPKMLFESLILSNTNFKETEDPIQKVLLLYRYGREKSGLAD